MINDIKRFLVVVEKGNITKSAKELYITQPALSLSLKRLEREVGTKLFVMNGKKFQPTKAGDEFYQVGSRIIALWENMKHSATAETVSDRLVIGVFDNAAVQLTAFFEKHISSKRTRLEILIESSDVLRRNLKQNMLDIAICVLDPNQKEVQDSTLIYTYNEMLIPVGNHQFDEPIERIPFILYNGGSTTRTYIDNQFSDMRVKPTVIVESTSPYFMKQLALQGVGVAFLPENTIHHELLHKQLVINTIPRQWGRDIGIYVRKEVHDNVRLFAEDLIRTMISLSLRPKHSR